MEYFAEKAMEVVGTSWQGFAFAALLWMTVKGWKWVTSPSTSVSDETRLFNYLHDALTNPNMWVVNNTVVETQAGVQPKLSVNINSASPGASIGGESMADIIPVGRLRKLARMANRIKVVKDEQRREARINKIIGATVPVVQQTSVPANSVPAVVINNNTHPAFPAALNNAGKQ